VHAWAVETFMKVRIDVVLVVASLALIALVGLGGVIFLAAHGKPVDSSIVSVMSGAAGALGAMLARTQGADTAAKAAVLVLGLVGISSLEACGGSFEEARLVGLKTAAPMAKAAAADRSPDLEQYCRELDDRRIRAGAIAKGAGVVAGVAGAGAGISEALVDAPKGVALGAAGLGVAAGAAAAYEVVTAEGLGAAWARSCTP